MVAASQASEGEGPDRACLARRALCVMDNRAAPSFPVALEALQASWSELLFVVPWSWLSLVRLFISVALPCALSL